MAIFIDNVTSKNEQRRHNDLGKNAADMYLRITEGMAQLIKRDVIRQRALSISRIRASAYERFGGTPPDPVTEADEILASLGQVQVSRETFNKWLLDPKFVSLL